MCGGGAAWTWNVVPGTLMSNFGWGGDWGDTACGEYISCGVVGGGVGPGGEPQKEAVKVGGGAPAAAALGAAGDMK